MITLFAILARGRRLPPAPDARHCAPSIHYTMPHARRFVAGVSASAVFHAGLFFGLPGGKPPPVPPVVAEKPIPPIWGGPTVVELTPPPTGEKKEKDPRDSAPDPNNRFARLPDPPASPRIDAVPIVIERFDPGRPPNLGDNLPGVPTGAGNGRDGPAVDKEVWNIKDLDRKPEITFSVAPRYPFELRTTGTEGNVVVRFVVTPMGEVRDVVVLATNHARFADAATEALLRWRFNPGMRNKRKVSTLMELPLKFTVTP